MLKAIQLSALSQKTNVNLVSRECNYTDKPNLCLLFSSIFLLSFHHYLPFESQLFFKKFLLLIMKSQNSGYGLGNLLEVEASEFIRIDKISR